MNWNWLSGIRKNWLEVAWKKIQQRLGLQNKAKWGKKRRFFGFLKGLKEQPTRLNTAGTMMRRKSYCHHLKSQLSPAMCISNGSIFTLKSQLSQTVWILAFLLFPSSKFLMARKRTHWEGIHSHLSRGNKPSLWARIMLNARAKWIQSGTWGAII